VVHETTGGRAQRIAAVEEGSGPLRIGVMGTFLVS
jgi:hypothetical protein